MMISLNRKWAQQYFDSLVSSVAAMIEDQPFVVQRVYTCSGTAHTNQKFFPKELKCTSWSDPSTGLPLVTSLLPEIGMTGGIHLSTIHSASVEIVQMRPKGGKNKEPAIVDYNQKMNVVDTTDQHLSYYILTKRKTTKWWKKIFWQLIDLYILNSSCLSKKKTPVQE